MRDAPISLGSPPGFRTLALALAGILVAAELALFAAASRLGALAEPAAGGRATALFVLFGTVLTLQAMGAVGVAWLLVAVSRTTLRGDRERLVLEHPWRRWSGGWDEIGRAWVHRDWLTLETAASRRRWHIRLARPDDGMLDVLRERLPSGVWLNEAETRAHLRRIILVPVVAGLGAGLLALWAVKRLLGNLTGL